MRPHVHPAVRVGRADIPEGWTVVSTTEAARRACVASATVRTWASRGKIKPVGWVEGRPYYLLADVLAVEEAMRRAPRYKRMLAARATV